MRCPHARSATRRVPLAAGSGGRGGAQRGDKGRASRSVLVASPPAPGRGWLCGMVIERSGRFGGGPPPPVCEKWAPRWRCHAVRPPATRRGGSRRRVVSRQLPGPRPAWPPDQVGLGWLSAGFRRRMETLPEQVKAALQQVVEDMDSPALQRAPCERGRNFVRCTAKSLIYPAGFRRGGI